MVRYMHSTSHPDPDCLAKAKQQQCSQWVTDEAVRALEQGACSRSAQLEHLAEHAKVLSKEPTHTGAAGSGVMRAVGTAKEVSMFGLLNRTSTSLHSESCLPASCAPQAAKGRGS